jgi:cytochrome b561
MNSHVLSLNNVYKFFIVIFLLGCVFSSWPVLAQEPIDIAAQFSSADDMFKKPADVYKRLDNNEGSWSALLITISSLFIAYTLNHLAPKIRTIGTVLAAFGCFAVVGWFVFFVLNSEVLTNPKKAIFPTDIYKPLFLWLQVIVALLAGLFLLRVACWQNRRDDALELPLVNTQERFGLVSRYLHWVTAVLFIALFPIGIFASMIPEEATYRQGYYVVHKTIGSLTLMLVVARIIWHLSTATPKLESGLKRWEYRTAKVGHFMLYFLMFALPISGFIMSTSAAKLSQFFIWDYPLLWEKNIELAKLFGLLHKLVLPYLFYVVIGAHILGALKHHFIDKHYKSIHRMVS